VDGNFHADHIKMRRPELDVMLTNGQGYMADDIDYKDYLSVAKEPRVVSISCIAVFIFLLIHVEDILSEPQSSQRS
jgi:hypothetical protein